MACPPTFLAIPAAILAGQALARLPSTRNYRRATSAADDVLCHGALPVSVATGTR